MLTVMGATMTDSTARDEAAGSSQGERTAGPYQCDLIDGEAGIVTHVIDGDTLVLDDHLEVRLVGMQAPKLPLGRPGFVAWPLSTEAKASLETLALGQAAQLRYGGTRRDRYSRALAHVTILPEGGEPIWVQQAMLAQGLARVYSFADNRQCVGALMNVERAARNSGLGLWRDPYYAIRPAADPALVTRHDVYDLVEGRVISVGERGPIAYLDFGRDWSTDFTAVLTTEAITALAESGIAVETLRGQRVRLRGWIESHGGPSMRVTHPEQLELLDQW
ncbi:thermonuclease family protein [Kaistia granuli]|uniref:thermonuclease family protein n=1 Tax=Kaistia granuli TaxID=363259 RepID=UPI00037CF4E5|nr:thermonuclease family protein [Kaistia granuli]